MPTPDLYFALIHARTSIPNQWVDAFYHRLDLEVQSRAAPAPGLRVGSLYFPTAGEVRRALDAGLPRVRVLVPLYTREFLHDPPPDFGDRLHRLEDPAEQPFVHPVLWEPHLPARRVNGLAQAVSLGDSVQEYLDCGMASICRLNAFTRQLRRIVEELADRLVVAAEAPDRTPAWMLSRARPPVPQKPLAPSFLIIVVRADWRDPDWSPYGTGPVTERARDAAQRLSLLTEIRTGPATDGLQESAGVLLLDSGMLDDPRDRRAAEEFLRKVPPWMTVVMVIGTDHADRAHELAAEARAMAPNGVQIARDGREFQRAVDEAVSKARRNFLRSRQTRRPWEDSR
ncbi:hypothetical protein [Actinoplanes derwentensis]|uniref:Uncharacterized protein n=1 Tax=Actinoplanes derwentensis TaxID=113562 RepID=A0A1H2C4T6_9ACTN|nr:hypothetical protein [Actinoplanes derwentensis]GID84171.1 hypothetical protein Ade03nite_30950 [Actinoplanes derwentensis]SDT65269.1 hypothetical protein SAMN04489716_5226 [Actinoplanes derwentensis]